MSFLQLNILSHLGLWWIYVFSSFPSRQSLHLTTFFFSRQHCLSWNLYICGKESIGLYGYVLGDLSVTLSQVHGGDEKQLACLHSKMVTTHPTKFSSNIFLAMLMTWYKFRGFLLETFCVMFSFPAGVVSGAYPMSNRRSVRPVVFFSNQIGYLSFHQIFAIFCLNVHNNIAQKFLQAELWFLLPTFQVYVNKWALWIK